MNNARERVIDALLTQHLSEHTESMEARYRASFATLDATTEAGRASHSVSHFKLPSRLARAALIALVCSALFLMFPVESSASSVLGAALNAESQAHGSSRDRRYEIVVIVSSPGGPGGRDQATREFRGTWDMRGDESRLDLKLGDRMPTTRADSHAGAWERDARNVIRPLDSREIWPRWIKDGDGEVAIEQMDHLLRLVQRSYTVAIARAGDESPKSLRGSMHIIASRAARVIGPEEIDLWIDTDRNVVLEARLVWGGAHPRSGSRDGDRSGAPPLFREDPSQGPPRGSPPARKSGPPSLPPTQRGPDRNGDSNPLVAPGPDEYRAARGMLPPMPPSELRLKRIEPVAFPPDHFTMPVTTH